MRVCLVCSEILGAHRNGGIGTATSHLAILLARHGHSVTLWYVGSSPLEAFSPWASYYSIANVSVSHYRGSTGAPINPEWMKPPVEIYEQLQDRSFDVILFQEYLALGHACLVAKRAGLAFGSTTLAVVTHSSTAWILEANNRRPTSPDELSLIHMEQNAVELADAVVSPSAYLWEWMTQAGWKLPGIRTVIPYFLQAPELLGAQPASKISEPKPVYKPAHLVFFGRLEERKGINIFLTALASQELKPFPFKLTFLGRPCTISRDEIRDFVAAHRPDLMATLEFQLGFSTDEALAYLSSQDCIPVMPSLVDNSPCVIYESLTLGLPFIASSSGGIPELIHAEDCGRCLFEPTPQALACKLRDVLSAECWESCRPSYDQSEIGRRWLAWFEQHAPQGRYMAKSDVDVPVADTTVVITHFEHPLLLEQNLRALATQSDRRFDVVLVDQGSRSEAALAFLDRASRGVAGLAIKLIRRSGQGRAGARNEGIRHATGEFVIFMDAENIPFPTMVEVFRQAAHASKAGIVTCQMQRFHHATGEPDYQELISGVRDAFSAGPIASGAAHNCFADSTAIYQLDLFHRIGYFHEAPGGGIEDSRWHLQACQQGVAVLHLPIPLFWYRCKPGEMNSTATGPAQMHPGAVPRLQEPPSLGVE